MKKHVLIRPDALPRSISREFLHAHVLDSTYSTRHSNYTYMLWRKNGTKDQPVIFNSSLDRFLLLSRN